MKIVDPVGFFGIDSGMRTLTVTAREKAVLLRAAAILEAGHDLLTDAYRDHQGDLGDLNGFCEAPDTIRTLVEDGLVLA